MDYEIDWRRLRERLQDTPVIVPVKHVRKIHRSPESLEKRKVGARARSKKRYWENREQCLKVNREWERANPEKVKAKKHRYYEKHKNDPEFKHKKAEHNRMYKARKRAERQAASGEVPVIPVTDITLDGKTKALTEC